MRWCLIGRQKSVDQSVYYSQLEQGARYLASLAETDAERRVHLGWANRYCRLAADAAPAVPRHAQILAPAC